MCINPVEKMNWYACECMSEESENWKFDAQWEHGEDPPSIMVGSIVIQTLVKFFRRKVIRFWVQVEIEIKSSIQIVETQF
jgi:hypothetical protein